MRIKMLKTLSGADGTLRHGTEHDVADDEALRLVDAGIAERITPPAKKTAASKQKTGA